MWWLMRRGVTLWCAALILGSLGTVSFCFVFGVIGLVVMLDYECVGFC